MLGAYGKNYLRVAVPSGCEGIFMVLLASADLIMVASLGPEAVAAVGIFMQPRMALLCFPRSWASAITLIAAKYAGQGRQRSAVTLLKQSIFFGVLSLGIIHGVFWLFRDFILKLMGATPDYMALASDYAAIATVAIYITAVTTVLQAVQLGFGSTAIIMRSNVAGNVVNVIANALLIFGIGPFPRLGVVGAAVGTVVGTLVALALTVSALQKKGLLSGGRWLPERLYFRRILPIFGSVFSEQGFERIGMLIFARIAADLGTVGFAVHNICMNICDIYYCFAVGFGKASMVLAGQSCGRESVLDWQQYRRVGIRWTLILSTISCVLTVIFRREIFSLYSNSPEAIALSGTVMVLAALVSYPEAHALVAAGILRGSGRTASVAAYSFVSVTILRPIMTAVFFYVFEWGITGIWMALLFDQCIRAFCAEFLVHRLDYMRVPAAT